MKTLLGIIVSLFSLSHIMAQDSQVTLARQSTSIPLVRAATGQLDLSLGQYPVDKRIAQGTVRVQWDMGEDHISDPATPFEAEVTFDITASRAGQEVEVFKKEGIKLHIDQDRPEAYFIADISTLITESAGNQALLFDRLDLTLTAVSLPTGYYRTKARLSFSSLLELGLKAGGQAPKLISIQPNEDLPQGNRIHDFTWEDPSPLEYYQIQVLRLFNKEEGKTEENDIITVLDWDKAMNFDGRAEKGAVSGQKYFRLTLAEGTGYYVARVRALGSYFRGGIADSRNWGAWSTYEPSGTRKLLQGEEALPYFYFKDPEEDKNWIYSRVFTEKNKVKETISYADVLLNARQAQTYLPSQQVTLITQTVLDHSGRPAVTSIPVPLQGRATHYQETFMKAQGSEEAYQAKHFDNDDNFDQPTPAQPFDYYNNNPDKSIPNDEGHGYTRTLFYNDALGRVNEQSGVGETHKIGAKTTRYLYSTASDGELEALFGDEAPRGESVTKTTTVDPNGVASITYTAKEGNVIATSLSFFHKNTNLDPLDSETDIDTLKVSDKITANVKVPEGFEAFKRFSVLHESPLSVSYSMSCNEGTLPCQTTKLDCDFFLTIDLIALDAQGRVKENKTLLSQSLSKIPCTSIEGKEYKIVSMPDNILLTPGDYLLRKRLRAGNASLAIKDNRKEISKQIAPISGLIARWLDAIEDASMLKDFNHSLLGLSRALNSKQLEDFDNAPRDSIFPVNLSADFVARVDAPDDGTSGSYQLYLNPLPPDDVYDEGDIDAGQHPIALGLKTPCCLIDVPIDWIPKPDMSIAKPVDENGNGTLETVNTRLLLDRTDPNPPKKEFSPDFEGYMLAFMEGCVGYGNEAELKKAIYENFMEGWEKEGTFNLMVYHMLHDKYNTNNTRKDSVEIKVQYEARELLNCWNIQLKRLKDDMCAKFDFYQSQRRQNVSSAYDDQQKGNNGGYDSDHDNIFDNSLKKTFVIIRWLVKKKLSRKMRDLQTDGNGGGGTIVPELGKFHLVREFLNCSGQKFAKILTPLDAQPLPEDRREGFAYVKDIPQGNVPFTINADVRKEDYFPDKLTPPEDAPYGYDYIPLNDWDPKKKVEDEDKKVKQTDESLFPFIKNPIYAFKYYEYPYAGDSKYQSLELETCYSDPNDCYQLGADSLIMLQDGKPLLRPCCSSKASADWQTPGCYADTAYFETMSPDIVGYTLDHGGRPAKLVVDDFCGTGRVRCSYTMRDWGDGERYAFYQALDNFVIPNEPGWGEPPTFDLTCEDLNTPHQWYTYEGPPSTQQEKGYPDLVNEVTIKNYPGASTLYAQQFKNDSVATYNYIKSEMEKAVSKCNLRCENRRAEFKEKLIATLNQKCYVIGGCRTDQCNTFNVIPEEDIDIMVEAIVGSCRSQCQLSTFSCDIAPCRDIGTALTFRGSPITSFALNYGTGGYHGPSFCGDKEHDYQDSLLCKKTGPDSLYQCQSRDPLTKEPTLLSWYEYTKLQQVESWDFEIDLPMKCTDEQGNPLPDSGGFTGIPPGDCDGTGGDCGEIPPNTSRGDTFVKKSKYEISRGNTLEALKKSDEPVVSPPIGINVTIDPKNNKK